jgi:hypothetical protein
MADRDVPDVHGDEGGGESTVAMEAPVFDSSVPSPLGADAPLPGLTPSPAEATRPVVPRVAAPPIPGPLPALSSAKAAPIQRPPRGRTVIGIAPPAEGGQPPPVTKRAQPPALSEFAPEDPRSDDAPTMAGVEGMIKGFADVSTPAIPTSVKDLAVSRGVPSTARSLSSPLATTAGAPSGRRSEPLPTFVASPDSGQEDESTRAVPRDELVRTPEAPPSNRDAQLVVADDAEGEDATLAVSPGMNAAHRAAPPRFSQGPMGGPTEPADFRPHPSPGAMPAGHPVSSPHTPTWDPRQQGWSPPGPMQAAPMMLHAPPGQAVPYAPRPPHWTPAQPQAPAPRAGLSGQMIVLIVAGVICVTIFLTGIILFVTTNF